MRHYQNHHQNPGQAAALAHQRAADSGSPPAYNAFAPTWLQLATVQALPTKLQHTKGVLQLQKNAEHSHPPSSSGPMGTTHFPSLAIWWPAFMAQGSHWEEESPWAVTEQVVLIYLPTHGVWREEKSRACHLCITGAQVLSYLSRRSDTRYVWLASMMNIS